MKNRLCCWLLITALVYSVVDGHYEGTSNFIARTPVRIPVTTSFLTNVPRYTNNNEKDFGSASSNLLVRKLQVSPYILSSLSIRGGDDDTDDEYDSDDEEDADFDDLFDVDDDDLANMDDDDFAEESTIDRMMVAWSKTPPVTKSYMTASFIATAWGYLMNKNQFPKILTLEWKAVLKTMQLWRPFTAFLNFGPFGIAYIMTAHFVWTYMSTLERLNHNKPYDFWIMMIFGSMSMIAGYSALKLSPKFLGHNLSTFFVYVWSRYHEGLEVNMFELFNTRAELLPWIFLAQTFLLEGEPPVLDFLGIVFGHVYHHLKVSGVLRAPQFVVDWYESDTKYSTMIRKQYKEISSDFEMQ